ncbi:MAG: response regulator [Methylotenera sp.]|nr:response regulator [Methylotenera sp.]
MPEAFDTGPLSWVKDEIDQSLKQVLNSFKAVSENPNEVASLRFSLTHLYQVSGALDMVGLEGCKRLCVEIEKLTSQLEKQVIPTNTLVMGYLIDAVNALSQYLQDLLNGAFDIPTKLYTTLKPIVEVQGEIVEESELFFPDISLSIPKDLPSNPIERAAFPTFLAEKRVLFQKSLLGWLKTKDAKDLDSLRDTISAMQQAHKKSAEKTLFWVASAFVDALAQPKIAALSGAKKLCRRLDKQLKIMQDGDAKVPSQLLRDVLYYVAISERTSDLISQVKDAFELDDLLPSDAAIGEFSFATLSQSELAGFAQLFADLPELKDLWADACEKHDIISFQTFTQKMRQLSDALKALISQNKSSYQVSLTLLTSINDLLSKAWVDQSAMSESWMVEVATALNLLESSAQTPQNIGIESYKKITTQIQRLHTLIEGNVLESSVDAFATEGLDSSTVEALAKQITASLQQLEKALDTFFRNSSNAEVLHDAHQPLQQIVAAFDMLEMHIPKSIARLSADYVQYFQSHANAFVSGVSHPLFELVAESLSMLGLFVEALPQVRPESGEALQGALTRLEQAHQSITAQVAGGVDEVSSAIKSSHSADKSFDAVITDAIADAELRDIFLEEAELVLADLAQSLQALHVNTTDQTALVDVRRAYHTFKGSGRTVGLVAIADIAWSVEKLLNAIIELKLAPNATQLSFVEKVTASIANWVAELQAQQSVQLDPKPLQAEAEGLLVTLSTNQGDATNVAVKPVKEEVLVGGTRKLSRAFFEIFLAEAQQHLASLQHAQQALVENVLSLPTDESRRAAHTLGSNSLTAGFIPIGELARALEHWLDAHVSVWTAKHISLYGNVVKALQDGLNKASELKNPKSSRALIKALSESTVAMQAEAIKQAETAVLEATEQSDDDGEANDAAVAIASASVIEVIEPSQMLTQSIKLEKQREDIVAKTNTKQLTQTVDQELLALFVEEARELVPQVGRDLRNWRTNPLETDYSESLQRVLHTLKGSARMAGQADIGDTVHSMEDGVIHALRHQVSEKDFEAMFEVFDRIGYMLEELTSDRTVTPQDQVIASTVEQNTRKKERKSQFLRVRSDVLDRLINEAGEVSIMRSRVEREMQNFKHSSTDLTDSITRMRAYLREIEIEAETQMQSRMSLLQEANETFDPLEFDRFTRLQELTRMMAESVNDVSTIQHGLLLNLDQTDAALQQQNRMNRELQQGLMGVRMLPFATIAERLQRIVRQTARDLNKHVEMTIEGESIELDRSVLDKLGAPLEHLLRNAVAHGLEETAARKKAGKSEVGHITLKVMLENDEISLVVVDDGMGVNLDKVKQKAISKGLFSENQELTDQSLMEVIFESGFSTADVITQVAGRGVGLDAVRSDIAALGGRIDVSNVVGAGAMFNIYLPVTLSVAQVVMVRAGEHQFAIPSVMVEQVQKLKPNELLNAYQNHQITWASRDYPMHLLSKLIGDDAHVAQAQAYTPVVMMRSGAYRTALHVEEVLGNQEVVMKQIGTQLTRVPGMIGATVLGDGEIVLVINPVQLANREVLSMGAIKVSTTVPVVEVSKKVALVVDDSLTMRKVLSRVLEREDFEVVTANDGVDAIQALQETSPDIILTDIEMPRMDGFEFARYVRDNPATSKIPMIVISSRTAEKHRNVATEIGVDAFLGKPVQDEELIAQVQSLLSQKH